MEDQKDMTPMANTTHCMSYLSSHIQDVHEMPHSRTKETKTPAIVRIG